MPFSSSVFQSVFRLFQVIICAGHEPAISTTSDAPTYSSVYEFLSYVVRGENPPNLSDQGNITNWGGCVSCVLVYQAAESRSHQVDEFAVSTTCGACQMLCDLVLELAGVLRTVLYKFFSRYINQSMYPVDAEC